MLERAARARGLHHHLDVLVPVPTHLLKRFSRGIDHTRIIAEELARSLDLKVLRALRREHPTVAQGQARGPRERQAQVRGAFRAVRSLAGLRIGLVDDLVTSGATARECARVLLAAGAAHVVLLVVATPRFRRGSRP